MGDSNYFVSIALSVMQAEKIHPECLFGVYDWGFSSKEKAFFLARPSVVLINWSGKFVEKPFPDNSIRSCIRKWKYISVIRDVFKRQKRQKRQREWFLAQKPYCLLDWAAQNHTKNFIFLDGDAFLMGNVNELFNLPEDMGVTLRRQHEIDFRNGRCQVLNSGVIAFVGGKDKNISLIEQWIKEMQETTEYLVEQTALTRMILGYEAPPKLTPGVTKKLAHGPKEYNVAIMDCERFNYNWIEEGVDPGINKVVHFKGGRHSKNRFKDLLQSIGLQREFDEVTSWKNANDT